MQADDTQVEKKGLLQSFEAALEALGPERQRQGQVGRLDVEASGVEKRRVVRRTTRRCGANAAMLKLFDERNRGDRAEEGG